MKLFKLLICTSLFLQLAGSLANAGGSHFGFNAGFGIPYTSQFGLNYLSNSNKFSVDLSYNSISVSAGISTVSLTKPEINLKWHPFAGSFFMGVGLGQETLSATATDVTTSETAKITITATTVTPNFGWMWGLADAGFFAGIDFGMQTPSGVETKVETGTIGSTTYTDAIDQGNKIGNVSLPVVTVLRVGYLF